MMAMFASHEMGAGSLADALRHLRGHRRFVGAAPDPVRAEKFARHVRLVAITLCSR
jgi:hypothetical protein